jgi:predicted transposase YdaD
LQEGRQEGLEEGRQEGLQEGRQEGRQEGAKLIVRLLQEGLSYEEALVQMDTLQSGKLPQ